MVGKLLASGGDVELPVDMVTHEKGGVKVLLQTLDGHGDGGLADPKVLGNLRKILIFYQLLVIF